MKFSTFYKDKKGKQVYTTKTLTDHHEYLRTVGGTTYEHEDNTPLFFTPGMPLDAPLTFTNQINPN